jgi:hypothetical protein
MRVTLPPPEPIHHWEKLEEVAGELPMVFVKPKEPLAINQVFVKEVATARRHLKVRKMESPFHYDPIGSNHMEFGAL